MTAYCSLYSVLGPLKTFLVTLSLVYTRGSSVVLFSHVYLTFLISIHIPAYTFEHSYRFLPYSLLCSICCFVVNLTHIVLLSHFHFQYLRPLSFFHRDKRTLQRADYTFVRPSTDLSHAHTH